MCRFRKPKIEGATPSGGFFSKGVYQMESKLSKYKDSAVIPLRIVLGVVFIFHGAQKLFGGLEGFTGLITNLGLPAPSIIAFLVALLEFGGGILILVGLFTRITSALIAIDMLVALFAVHLKNGFSVGKGGYEFVFVLLGIAIALVLTGSGPFSIGKSLLKKDI